MTVQEIKGENYIVKYNADYLIQFQGQLALYGSKEYAPIRNLLTEVADNHPMEMTIDLRELAFINSSGINMLFRFVIGLRQRKETQLVILGSNHMSWQGKSLKNFQKFLPSVKLEVK